MQAQITTFNPVQLHLLRMFSVNQTASSLQTMKKILFEFYCQEVDRVGAQIAAKRGYTDADLEQMSYQHNRI